MSGFSSNTSKDQGNPQVIVSKGMVSRMTSMANEDIHLLKIFAFWARFFHRAG